MQDLGYSLIHDEVGFQSLANDWNELAASTDRNSVFLRHEWADAAWQWLKIDGKELCIVCVQRDGQLIGLCPLVRHQVRCDGMHTWQLSGLAIPDSQELSLLADPADINDVAAGLVSALNSGSIRWDTMVLEKLPVNLPSTQALQDAAAEGGYVSRKLSQYENPGISLAGEWEAYYGRRSRRLKKGNNLVRNRLQRDGKAVEIQCIDSRSEVLDPGSLLRTLTDISARSWKASTGLTLDNPGPGAFLARLSEHGLEKGWFLAWILTIDGEPVAMEYQLEFNGVISGLRADYDEGTRDYSPGTLLNWRIIEQLFGRGASYYALGPGSNPYKARWIENSRDLVDLIVYGNSLRARVVRLVEQRMKPLVKRILGKADDKEPES